MPAVLPPWWEDPAFPGLLDFELDQLEQAGYAPRLDEEARDPHGLIRVALTVPVDGLDEPLELVATYPDSYPFFRPEVQAPDLDLDRHQHPFAHTLCLLARGSEFWDVEMSVADLIREQLPKLLEAVEAAGTPEAYGLEEAAGEPFAEYYDYWPQAAVLVDGAIDVPEGETDGELLVGYTDGLGELVRGAVLEVRRSTGELIWQADDRVRRQWQKTAKCRWVRTDRPIRKASGEEFAAELTDQVTDLRRPARDAVKLRSPSKVDWDLVGVVFPDETTYQEQGSSWVFLARRAAPKKTKGRFNRYELIRAWRAGAEDRSVRAPALRPLRDRTVALIGTGALGAPLALEFAKAGVDLIRLMDHDFIDPATSSRWPAGARSAGLAKVQWLYSFILSEYPHTNVEAVPWRLGSPRLDPASAPRPEREILEEFFANVDLIVDASAELGVQYAMSTWARTQGIDYLCLTATAGAWGGIVARIPADSDGCWSCFQVRLAEHGPPPADPAGEVQPPGCAQPTFTGTGFELLPVTMMAARMAVATLCRGDDGYLDVPWDVATLALRDEGGKQVLPDWDGFSLERHPGCTSPSLHP